MERLTGKFTGAIALTLMIVLLLSVAVPIAAAWATPSPTNRFVDVPDYPHWQNDPVSWADRNALGSA